MSIESFVFNVAEKVLEKVASTAYNEICFAWGLEGELKKLEGILSTVKAVLLDAEEKQTTNRELRVWLAKLKEALYDAEDVLDEFECETKRRQVLKLYGTTTKKVGRFFSSSNPLSFRFKMGHKIKQVRERLDEIASHRTKFHLNEQNESREFVHRTREMTHSYVQASEIIGRDEDKEKIIKLLMNPRDNRKLSVIPIVGMGGLGKTALAKLVYNDERVNTCFQLKIWICVSEDFDTKMLVEKIIQSATGSLENISNLEMDPLQRKLQETIGDRKYLLVLDDVWNDDPMKWNQLRELLLMGGNGSKILVTTRSDLVASIVGTIPAYELCGLPHDKCMALFVKFAFKEGQKKHYPNLLKIGDEIVKKCRGVPLAVKSLASLLFLRTDEDYWKFVRDNELWKLEQKENEILPALRLSYEQLPSHLKSCFAYCSFFPKDHQFENFVLVQFWMAYGLIQPSNENEELEDIGFRYIQELASRSFFQDFDNEFGGILVFFKMHDLMHDLALSLMQNECAVITSSTKPFSKNVRHLLFSNDNSFSNDLPTILQTDHVRTIHFLNKEKAVDNKSILNPNVFTFRFLQTLDLSNSNWEVQTEKIGNLKHLRFLHLHGNAKGIKVLNSICKLQNLQTLMLCQGIEELPTDIRYLISLRFLLITTEEKRLSDNGIGCLKSLRFLLIGHCANLEFLFEDMQGLSQLRYLLINECNSLISLPQGMKYLVALKTLCISDCRNLDLKIEEGKSNGEGLRLEKLILSELPKLANIPDWLLQGSKYTLQLLHLEDCDNLKELPTCLQSIVSLQELRIEDCGELGERCEPKEGQDWSKIAHIPKVIIDGDDIQSTSSSSSNDDGD